MQKLFVYLVLCILCTIPVSNFTMNIQANDSHPLVRILKKYPQNICCVSRDTSIKQPRPHKQQLTLAHITAACNRKLSNTSLVLVQSNFKNLEDAFFEAAETGNIKLLRQYLIHKKLSPQTKDMLGRTALYYAALHGNLDALQFLIQQQGSLTDIDNQGETLLHASVQGGHKHIIEFLLKEGLNVNVTTYSGMTLMHTAAAYGTAAMIRYLKFHKIAIDKQTNSGNTPLHIAHFYKNTEAIHELSQISLSCNLS